MIPYSILSITIAILMFLMYLYRYGKSDRFSWNEAIFMFIFPLLFWPVLVAACLVDDIRKTFFKKKKKENKNKRTYDWSLVEEARVNSELTKKLNEESWVGECEHPMDKDKEDQK